MRPSVVAAFEAFTERFEGRVHWMYLDIHKPNPLVTTAIGLLIDPVELAVTLPWKMPDGSPASELRIRSCWHAVKMRPDLATHSHRAFAELTDVRLDDEAIAQTVLAKLAANLIAIRSQPDFAAFDRWPAPAQLGLLSMAWAQGPNFAKWPRFRVACAAANFNVAALQCTLDEIGNRGLIPRNKANRALFRSAAFVRETGGNLEELHLPEAA